MLTSRTSLADLDVPSIGLKITTHVFERHSMEVSDYVSGGEPAGVFIALTRRDLLP